MGSPYTVKTNGAAGFVVVAETVCTGTVCMDTFLMGSVCLLMLLSLPSLLSTSSADLLLLMSELK